MTADSDGVAAALARHDAFSRAADGQAFTAEPTVFSATVRPVTGPETATDGGATVAVRVRIPSLDAATVDQVGDAVRSGWFETLQRRLEDAPKATRAEVTLAEFSLRDAEGDPDEGLPATAEAGADLVVTYAFSAENPDRVARVAKTFVEYVEGTYVESVIPGYEYHGPVAQLLDSASQGEGTGTPL